MHHNARYQENKSPSSEEIGNTHVIENLTALKLFKFALESRRGARILKFLYLA
jgi:hypothetical protein